MDLKWKYGLIKENQQYRLTEVYFNEYGDECYIEDYNFAEDSYQGFMDTLRMIEKDLEDPIIIDLDNNE